MSYPGNSSLAEEIQQKILNTYEQALDLAESGQHEEALLGCDFIQRLDPDFKPVLTLQQRLESQPAEIPVDDLRDELATFVGTEVPSPSPVAPPQEDEEEPFEDEVTAKAPDDTALASEPADVEPIVEKAPVEELPAEEAPEPAETADYSEEEASLLEAAFDLSALEEEVPEAPEEEREEEESQEEPKEEGDSDSEMIEPAIPEPSGPEPSAALDQESSDRIDQLLAEGQTAFEQAEYQSAIDAWSRIFLVDIDHPEANRRIELARKLKAEVERRVDETFHEALGAIDDGSLEVAAEKFRKVLELQPTHLAAQEHLDRLSAGEVTAVHELPQEEPDLVSAEAEPPPVEDDYSTEIPESEFDYEPLDDASLDDFGETEQLTDVGAKPAGRSSRRTVSMIAAAALFIGLAAAWFLYSNWDRFFPNAAEEIVAPQVPKVDPIVRAQGLHVSGNTAMAISQLRRLPPAHPKYAEAQALIAQWETVVEVEDEEGPSEEDLLSRDELVAQAREAFANRRFLNADKYFSLAAQIAPLDEGAVAIQAETIERLEPLRTEIEIFRQGEWSYALRTLWRMHEEDPSNRDVLQLMVDGYFNMGVRELQRGDPTLAVENLREAAALASEDAEVQRLLDFADTYSQRPPDLLYRIFVKYQPFRS